MYDDYAERGMIMEGEAAEYVSRVGQRVAAVAGWDEPFVFSLVDSGMVNAMALPDGYIFVFRGLFTRLQTEGQLAAVLGHEVGTSRAATATRARTPTVFRASARRSSGSFSGGPTTTRPEGTPRRRTSAAAVSSNSKRTASERNTSATRATIRTRCSTSFASLRTRVST